MRWLHWCQRRYNQLVKLSFSKVSISLLSPDLRKWEQQVFGFGTGNEVVSLHRQPRQPGWPDPLTPVTPPCAHQHVSPISTKYFCSCLLSIEYLCSNQMMNTIRGPTQQIGLQSTNWRSVSSCMSNCKFSSKVMQDVSPAWNKLGPFWGGQKEFQSSASAPWASLAQGFPNRNLRCFTIPPAPTSAQSN